MKYRILKITIEISPINFRYSSAAKEPMFFELALYSWKMCYVIAMTTKFMKSVVSQLQLSFIHKPILLLIIIVNTTYPPNLWWFLESFTVLNFYNLFYPLDSEIIFEFELTIREQLGEVHSLISLMLIKELITFLFNNMLIHLLIKYVLNYLVFIFYLFKFDRICFVWSWSISNILGVCLESFIQSWLNQFL